MMSPRLPLKPASAAIVVVLIDEHRGGADAGEDQRHRQRQLDARAGSRTPLMPMPAGGVDEIGVDAVDAEVGVGDDRRHREDHERELDDRQAEAEERVADRQHHEARQRAADVADVDRDERAAVEVAEPHAERHARSATEIASADRRRPSASRAPGARGSAAPDRPATAPLWAMKRNASTNSCTAALR